MNIEDYETSFRGFVHFSFKTVNSNAPAGGIRLGAEDALRLPYVSARTLLAQGMACMTDYTKNAGPIATHFKHAKQARTVASGIVPKKKADKESAKSAEKDDAPELAPDALQAVGAALARCTQGRLEDGCDNFLDPRLRQLLLPRVDDAGNVGYRSVTPLTAGGLCQIVRAHVTVSNEAHKLAKEEREKENTRKKNPKAVIAPLPTRSIQSAQMGIGGSNPQNVGGLVREMQQLMYMAAPQAKGGLRQALAMHHKGVDLNIPVKLVHKYADFLKTNTEDGVRQSDMESREEERKILAAFVDDVMDQVDEIRRVLDQHLEMLPVDVTGKPMYFTRKLHRDVKAAWVDESLRGRDWESLAAAWLANAIGKFEVQSKNGPKRLLSLDAFGIKSIESLIKEFLA